MPHALTGQLFPTPPFDFDKSLDFLGFFAPMEGEQSIAGRTLQVFILSLVPQLPGDFDRSGTVDAADYNVWRNGLGVEFTPDDYLLWRANFGASSAAAVSTLGVPEPATSLLTAAMLLFVSAHRRRAANNSR